ncbi:MAG: glycoside hydrolase family 3 protein [Clostridia bacterium]|nr:glycoside hydrolase family 3 protein [Clostridia bacterium]
MKKPLLSEMTLREKIGQMLAPHHWDVYGKVEMSYDYSVSDMEEVKALYAKEQFGTIRGEQVGVFYADPENEKKIDVVEGYVEGSLLMNNTIKVDTKPYRRFLEKHNTYMKIPALVGGDCSVGAANVFNELSWVVNAAAIGAADSEELTYEFASAIGREMRCGGHNWRWAPVVDLGNRNSYATLRTLAMDDPERTVRLAKAYIKGLQDVGVAATVKHFPSEGRTEARDAHFTSTMNPDSLETWWNEQGRVYQELFDYGVYSVMVGHQSFPAVDDEMINGKYRPSTISKKVVTDLLKGEMGFKGVVITDGIGMAGLFSLLPYEELIVELVNAGNDVILGSKINSGDLIEKAVKDGRIEESRIDDACQRVLDMKEKLGMFEDGYYNLPYEAEDIVENTRKVSAEIAKKSITLVRDKYNLLPLDKKDIKKVSIVISTHTESFLDNVEELQKAFEERGIEVYTQRRLKSAAELKGISDNCDLIIYAACLQMHQPAGYPRFFAEEAMSFYHAFTHGKEKSIGVSFGYPYIHYDTMENVNTFINAYNPRPETMQAFVGAILGEFEIKGNTPVLLEPRANSK